MFVYLELFIQLFQLFYYKNKFLNIPSNIYNIIKNNIIVFYNIDCGNSETCILLSEGLTISNKNFVYFYIIKSFFKSLRFFIELKFINDFTVFHIIIFIIFIVLISNIIEIISDYNLYELLMIIITSSFELFGIFIFVEIIELNFCELNKNLRRFIDSRAETEINNIGEISDSSDIEDDKKEDNEDENLPYP